MGGDMKVCCAVIAVLLSISQVQLEPLSEPSVAFMCNRPAMHLTTTGWLRDEDTNCLKDPVDILNYCRKIYTKLEVWNVVESSQTVTINNWCSFGRKKCHHKFTVRPFRCLVGPFQSEALQVPERCRFDHIHDSRQCKSYEAWNQSTTDACAIKNSWLHGFSTLQPCGIDGFNGAEFVCCPNNDLPIFTLRPAPVYRVHAGESVILPCIATGSPKPLISWKKSDGTFPQSVRTAYNDGNLTVVEVKKEDEGTYECTATNAVAHIITTTLLVVQTGNDLATKLHVTTTTPVAMETSSLDTTTDLSDESSAYTRYLHLPIDAQLNEHTYFLRAKSDLEKRHHEKVTKMMKEWATARHRVQEIKRVDVKGGEKFNREMTARFQKAYEALEKDNGQEKKHLLVLHQQRAQIDLNNKRRHAMDRYMESLSEENPDATRVLKSLMQYVKTEQKDRIHTINHYQHVEESDPVEAESIRASVAEHLREIDQRVTQAIDMLGRLPKYEKKIRTQIEKFLSSYQSLDESLAVIMAKINDKSNSVKLISTGNESETASVTLEYVSTTIVQPASYSSSSDKSSAVTTDVDTPTMNTQSTVTSQVSTNKVTTSQAEQKHHHVELKPLDHVANMDKSDLIVLENYIKKLPVKIDNSVHLAAPLGIAVGGIAVFFVVIISIAVLRRRATSIQNSRNITEIDHAASATTTPEVNTQTVAPQMNGYENPTYKYFTAKP